jgi:2-hydroxy-3-keto-5-methylthiopentenyl-1-phosphate phosphatase
MKNFRLKIFCDFDGTITRNDVWLNSLARFIEDKSELKRICDEFVEGKISSRTTSELHLKLIKNFDKELFKEYLAEEEIDSSFPEFVNFCLDNEHGLYIVSSGLDFYISEILKRYKISVPFFANRMIADESNGSLSCEMTYSDEYCLDCATCKRNILLTNTNDLGREVSVYIGDGASDYCVSSYADIVFAKGKLASYCWKNNITYFEFTSFNDISKKLIRLTEGNKIKHRQEASFRRREIFMGG